MARGQDDTRPCGNCGRRYRDSYGDVCPMCGYNSTTGAILAGSPSAEGAGNTETHLSYPQPHTAQILNPDQETQRLLRELLAGVNRTTFAVRAMVSYAAILLIGYLAGALIYGFGALTQLFLFQVIGIFVAVAGTIAAHVQLIREWAASKVPDRF